LYVININKKENSITVGPKDKLIKYFIYVEDLNFFSNNLPNKEFNALIKIRSGKKLISAFVEICKNNKKGTVQLMEPEFGVAPGQACVFYNNYQKMIGGGWITASEIK
jgi:tRNA-specific 2-thiouridylase